MGPAKLIAEGWGRNIHTFRVGFGTDRRPDFSLEKVAEALNVASTTVLRWEKGRIVPPLEFMLRLADFFGVPPSVLFPMPDRRVKP